ncbi:TIGR04222 domain-containing membrane protein [Mycobacterium sp. NPDC050441]|uniref:TIGR04222 domain-containing membrane protein n=1 Tax=Mycobacterium sp. NPDC050441 TaxID=3155403 RepID=UPI0033D9C35E
MTAEAKWYLAALVAAAVFAVLWRTATAPRRPASQDPISPTQLAYLRSDIAPVVAALAGLRASGRITGNGRVDRAVPAGPEDDRFTEQTLARVASDADHTVPSLYADSGDDLAALEKQLSERGLLRSQSERTRMRWGTAPSFVVLAIGIGYCVYLATHAEDHPSYVVPLVVLILATVGYSVAVLPRLLTVDRLTRAGRQRLAAEQGRLAYLNPAERPAFETYGPVAVALSVAVFGTGALWAVDSDYSSSVQLAGESSGGGDGGGSGGSGASCGGDGGGCGSGCGGGCGGCGGCGG